MGNRTFTMIKPDAMKNGYAGAIIDRMIREGFRIIALKMTKLSAEKAGEFYAIHKERPFYGELVDFMSSGPIIVVKMQCTEAIAMKMPGSRVHLCFLPLNNLKTD